MALILKDRVKETSTTTGTGTLNLDGAVAGFESFVSAVGNTNLCYYAIQDANGSAWEVGVGTVTDAAPDTLSRDTVLASSNSDNLISLSSGTHSVFLTYPAERSVYRNLNDQVVLTASGVIFSDSTVQTTAAVDTTYTAGTGLILNGTEFHVSGVDTSLLQGTISTAQIANDAIDSQHYTDGSIDNAHLADNSVGIAQLSATGTASESKYLAGNNSWKTASFGLTASNGGTSLFLPGSIPLYGTANEVTVLFNGSTGFVWGLPDDVTIKGDLNVGTIASGVWQGTAIAHAYIGADAIDGDNIGDNVIDSEHYAAGSIDLEHMSSESVDEDNLYISNTGSNGQFLSKQSGNDGGLTWATPTDTNTTYSAGSGLQLAGTTFNVQDDYLRNNANDTTTGTITAGGFSTTGVITVGQAFKSNNKSNADSATITFNLDQSNFHTVTLGGNRTLALSNPDVGQKFAIRLQQDSTGGRTVTWFSTIKWPDGVAPVLSTTGNKADLFGFVCTSGGQYDGFGIGYNL